MPELPEVESARRRVEAALAGHRVVQVATVPDRIVFAGVSSARFARALRDRLVQKVHRKGKHLWMELDQRPWPLFHFGMTGSFELYESVRDRPRFWKVELLMDDGVRLAMPDARRFGRIRLLDEPEERPPCAIWAETPCSIRLRPRRWPRCWSVVTHPSRPCSSISASSPGSATGSPTRCSTRPASGRIAPRPRSGAAEVRRLRSRLLSIVRRAVLVDADSDRFPRTWLFHHRWGKNALARTSRGETITHHTIGGRTTAWVPKRQR